MICWDMLDRYGELCTQEKAGFILGVTQRTIANMLNRGQLRRVGCRVDVRSIADYIEDPVPGKARGGNLRNMFYNASVEKFSAQA